MEAMDEKRAIIKAIANDLDVMDRLYQELRFVDYNIRRLGFSFRDRRRRKQLYRRKEILTACFSRIDGEIDEKRRWLI